MPITTGDLLRMSGPEREDLFARSPAGPMPDGETRGTAIFGKWYWLRLFLAGFARAFKWQGKVFDAKNGRLVNRVSVFGFRAIRAQLSKTESWVDGKECNLIDYSKTSLVARKVRDEIREVAPGVYLGKVWRGKTALGHFAVETGLRPRGWILWERVLAVAAVVVVAWLVLRPS
jgi:hypothetical protein